MGASDAFSSTHGSRTCVLLLNIMPHSWEQLLNWVYADHKWHREFSAYTFLAPIASFPSVCLPFPQTDQPVGKHQVQPGWTCILRLLEPVAISYVHNDICLRFKLAFIWHFVCCNSAPLKWCFLRKFIAWHSVYGGLHISAAGFNLFFFSSMNVIVLCICMRGCRFYLKRLLCSCLEPWTVLPSVCREACLGAQS